MAWPTTANHCHAWKRDLLLPQSLEASPTIVTLGSVTYYCQTLRPVRLRGVGAGPVPARCPIRGTEKSRISVNIAPLGASGWHGASPYTGELRPVQTLLS